MKRRLLVYQLIDHVHQHFKKRLTTLQRKAADYLNEKVNKLSQKQLGLLLFTFILIFGASTVSIIFHVFSENTGHLLIDQLPTLHRTSDSLNLLEKIYHDYKKMK